MKFAIVLTIISLVQSAPIPSTTVPTDNLNLDVISEKSDEIPTSDIIPEWLVEFKDFMDSDELDFNFESYLDKLDDEQTDELFYLIMLMAEASKNAQ